MNQPPTASISSRRAVRLCAWLLLCVAVVFGSSQARASLTRPTFQTPQVIALSFAPQVPSEPRFKLEITTGILCGNDPVNRHDPTGLAPITDGIRVGILQELDAAAGIVDRLTFPEVAGADAKLLGNLKHQKFAEILRNSQYSDFLLLEQSINGEGGAVKAQRWYDGVKEMRRWPSGSKRPDVMILSDSDYKPELMRGGGASLRGKIEAVVDLKTGAASLNDGWVQAVARRLGVKAEAIFAKRAGVSIVRPYLETMGAVRAGSGLKFYAQAGPQIVTTLADLYFTGQEMADEQNDANPFAARDSSGRLYGVGIDYEPIYFPFKSRFTRTRFRRESGWFISPLEGPFSGLTIPISQPEHKRLLEMMESSGTTLSDFALPLH